MRYYCNMRVNIKEAKIVIQVLTFDAYGDPIKIQAQRLWQARWAQMALSNLPERGQARVGYDRMKTGKKRGPTGHSLPTQTGDGCGSSVCQHPRPR
jgi:hypothetical protein